MTNPLIPNSETSEELLIANVTGEPYQPARLYYQVANKKTVLGVFKKLKCMDYDPSRDRWVWLYTDEAKKIKFENSYNKIDKEMHPIVIGYFVFRSDQEMLLELRSFDRVIAAIKFFSKRINYHAAEPTRLRLVNKLFNTPKNDPPTPPTSFDMYFDRDDVFIQSVEALEEELMEIADAYDDLEDRSAAISEYMEAKSRIPLPEIEEISVSIHDEGIDMLEMALKMKHLEAWQHWLGNEEFTQHDIIQKMLESIPDDDFED